MTDHAMTPLPSSPTPPDAVLRELVANQRLARESERLASVLLLPELDALTELLAEVGRLRLEAERLTFVLRIGYVPQFTTAITASQGLKTPRDHIDLAMHRKVAPRGDGSDRIAQEPPPAFVRAARASAPDSAPENANG